MSNNQYIRQPYWVGSKDAKSLAIVIPAQITKHQSFTPSTVFLIEDEGSKISLRAIKINESIPVDQSLEAQNQQASIVNGEN